MWWLLRCKSHTWGGPDLEDWWMAGMEVPRYVNRLDADITTRQGSKYTSPWMGRRVGLRCLRMAFVVVSSKVMPEAIQECFLRGVCVDFRRSLDTEIAEIRQRQKAGMMHFRM
jgi:hypothetical protein